MVPLLCLCATLFGEAPRSSLYKKTDSQVLLITIPKSGSHLMMKLLYMILGKKTVVLSLFLKHTETVEQAEKKIDKFMHLAFQAGRVVHTHFEFDTVVENHLHLLMVDKVIVLVRDPRDVLVSAVHWISADPIEQRLGRPISVDEKLMYLIQGELCFETLSYPTIFKRATYWMHRPGSFTARFEELCGVKGGQSREGQEASIRALCHYLGMALDEQELTFLADELWGNPLAARTTGITFRNGTTAGWKRYFKPEHVTAFKEVYGDLLIQLGYEEDNDW